MQFKPDVPKRYLLIVSGVMWSGVGIYLISLAFKWLMNIHSEWALVMILSGIVLGVAIALFGFRRIVRKNFNRIMGLPDRSCIFSFQAWYSYLLVAIMISMGIFLRHSALVPLELKIPAYIGIGEALFLSSLNYYRQFIRIRV